MHLKADHNAKVKTDMPSTLISAVSFSGLQCYRMWTMESSPQRIFEFF